MNRRLSPELASLIQHVELRSDGWQSKATEMTILAALWLSDSPISHVEVREILSVEFGAPLLPARVVEGLHGLRDSGKAVEISSDAWRLTEKARRECEVMRSEAEDCSSRAFEFFAQLLATRCPALNPEETWERLNDSFLLPLGLFRVSCG